MNPKAIDDMSMAMADVYAAVTDRILINLAHHFPYVQTNRHIGSWEYQTMMLAQMGKVEKETIAIIAQSLGGADEALKQALETAILQGLKNEEPKLRQAAMNGLLKPNGYVPELDPSQLQAFTSYYKQSADKLNLVNTVMLDSTKQAYQATVADVAQKIANTQGILNAAAGEVITGVSSWNGAMHSAVQKMVANGITGFIDHAGHKWSPEAYVAMDIKTTMFNTARAAVWERSEQYGSDLYQVSSHNAARPLCYPWQGKVISTSGRTGVTHDLDGNEVVIHSQDEIESFRYGGGLFGINCQHYPMTFIPEFSTLKGEPQDQATNDKQYAETQQQRALERKLREEKRDLEVMKAQGAPAEQIKAQRERVRNASADIDEFCDKTGLPRRRNREAAPVRAEWSTPTGNITRYNGGYIATNDVQPIQPIQPNIQPNTPPVVPNTPQIPEREAFAPANSIEEAEEYAKRFLESEKYGSVSYKGIDIEYANKANKALTDVFDQYSPSYKLGAIEPMNPRKSIFKEAIESSEACYQWGGDGKLFINPKFYKSTKAFAEHKGQIDQLMETVLNNGNVLLENSQGRKRDYIEALLGTGRQCVSQSYDFVEASIIHECGHMLDDKMFRKVMKDMGSPLGVVGGLSESMVKYGKGISGYSVSTVQEYIAESFTAWWYGETSIVDPELIKVFEEAKKIGK